MQFSNDNEHYLVVGTAFAYPNESEPSKGRFLVFRVSEQVRTGLFRAMIGSEFWPCF